MAHTLLGRTRAGPMRSVSLHLPFGARRHGPRAAPLEAFSRTEKIISFCRLLLTIYTLAVVTIDPQQPSFKPNFADVVLGAYVAYSALLFFLVRGAYVSAQRVGFFSAATDVAWVSVIALFTEGGTSPFFALHVFVILSVSVRWGLAATLFVTVLLALLYPGLVIGGRWFDFHESVFRSIHLFRPIYLLVIGYLIGYLGEHERRAKRKLGFMLGLPAAFRRNQAPGRAFTRLVRRALDYFKAERGTLALRDPESGRYFVWDVARRGGRTRLSLRITEDDPFPFRFAGPTEGFMANDVRPAGGTVTCYDVLTGVMVRKAIPAGTPLPGGGAAQALLVAPVLIQREPRGHAAVVRETRRKFTRDDLEFLLLLVGQAASGFENVRLQDKAEEVAVLEERGRIARDLHDGFIQSLAGIDLRVEACKLLLRRDPSRIHHELEELHEAVNRGYREVRHYLSMLRAASRPADDLWSSLDRLAAEFSIRERLRVHVERPECKPDLPTSTAYELTQIVREALRNAIRHGRATQAVVKVATRPSHLYLVVRDNGRGFQNGHGVTDADGFLPPGAAPWSIRERCAALGGTLCVRTEAGRGAELSLTIPAAISAASRDPDRRLDA
ncbi:MAG: GAF domain-containing sensor histidine kinase [Deltaproteobacteria bacterium]|nr:MAG: GAF domain-containing sensor histidine kinase [Deltaproteobacteria bacterium]